MYSLRWLVADWHNKSAKLFYTGVRIFGGFPPHITGGLLGKHNSGLTNTYTINIGPLSNIYCASSERRENQADFIFKFCWVRASGEKFIKILRNVLSKSAHGHFWFTCLDCPFRPGQHLRLFQ